MKNQPAFHEDMELIQSVLEGDSEARETLAKRLRCIQVFIHFRIAKTGQRLHPDEVDDLIQDVVVAVWKKVDRYRGDAPLEGWIYSFALLEMKAFMRRKSHGEECKQALIDASPNVFKKGDESPDDYEDIYAGLNRIDSDQARIIRLKHFGQMTFDEIARRLDLSESTAKTRYYRGLIRLKSLIDPARVEDRT